MLTCALFFHIALVKKMHNTEFLEKLLSVYFS